MSLERQWVSGLCWRTSEWRHRGRGCGGWSGVIYTGAFLAPCKWHEIAALTHGHVYVLLLDQEHSLLASSSILPGFQLGDMNSILFDAQASPTVTKFPAEWKARFSSLEFKGLRDRPRLVKCLLCMHKTLGSIPTTAWTSYGGDPSIPMVRALKKWRQEGQKFRVNTDDINLGSLGPCLKIDFALR